MLARFISPLAIVAVLAACSNYSTPTMTSNESLAAAPSFAYPNEYNQLREVGWNWHVAAK